MKKRQKRRPRRTKAHVNAMLMNVALASAAIYMRPEFQGTALFKRFAKSESGRLLQDKRSKAVNAVLEQVHTELLNENLVAVTREVHERIEKEQRAVMKRMLTTYVEHVERSTPGPALGTLPGYQQAKAMLSTL